MISFISIVGYIIYACTHLTQHEDASVDMFDHLIRVNDLQSSFDQYDITATDLVFVKEQIAGPIDTEQCSSQMQSVSCYSR